MLDERTQAIELANRVLSENDPSDIELRLAKYFLSEVTVRERLETQILVNHKEAEKVFEAWRKKVDYASREISGLRFNIAKLEIQLAGNREEHSHHLADKLYLKQDLDQLRTKLAETKAERGAIEAQVKVSQDRERHTSELLLKMQNERDELKEELLEARAESVRLRAALEKYSRSFIEDGELQIDAQWIHDTELSGSTDDPPGSYAKKALSTS